MVEDGVKDGLVGLFGKRKCYMWRTFQAGVEDIHLTSNECISISGSPSLSSYPFLMFSVLCCSPGACYISFPSTTIHISDK